MIRLHRALFVSVLMAMALPLWAGAAKPLLMPASALPAQKTALVFGQEIAYYDVGTGPTLVLVHGFATQARFDWGNAILPLSKHHRVIALDQIGWGNSDKPAIDYSIQTFVDFLGEFLRTLKVEKFDLAGESLGGWIVANYAMQTLSAGNTGPYALPKPEKLILSDAAGHHSLHSSAPAPVQGTLADAAGIEIVFYDKTRVTPEFIRAAWAMKMKANDGNTQRLLRANPKLSEEVVEGKLDRITIPTLVVWGAEDAIVPLADGQDYAAKIPHARLVVVPQSGHCPAAEKPEAFVAAVEEFLK
jgi:pimeloyl-ACP methyl ester carboxylesterase